MKTLSILIPFLNEEKYIWKLFQEVIELDLEKVWFHKEIVFINDGSSDSSLEIIKSIAQENPEVDIHIINNDKNSGKWFSIKQWVKKASGDIMIIQDADLEYDPSDYYEMLDKIEKEKLDFIYGSRNRGFVKFGFQYSYVSFLIWWLSLSVLTTLLSFKLVTDEPTCYKMYRKHLKDDLILPQENGFEWEPAVTMLLLRKWYKYGETPIKYFPRREKDGKKIKWSDGVTAIKTLFRWRFKKIK